MDVKVKCLSETARLPVYATPGAAAADLCADLAQPLTLEAGQRALVPTGLALELPGPEYVALVFARSGWAVRQGCPFQRGGSHRQRLPGRGEGRADQSGRGGLHHPAGERIAQLMIAPVVLAGSCPAKSWAHDRGEGGFGSTGRLGGQ